MRHPGDPGDRSAAQSSRTCSPAGSRTAGSIFCDEAAEVANPGEALSSVPRGPAALLIGPEGGFSRAERADLLQRPYVTALSLGPRILRADTAAVAALALVQSFIGDWR